MITLASEVMEPINGLSNIDWTTIIISLSSLLIGSTGMKWYEIWRKNKKELRQEKTSSEVEYRDSLKQRVAELEDKIELLQGRIEELINTFSERILILSTENAKLETLVSAYKRELNEKETEIKVLMSKK